MSAPVIDPRRHFDALRSQSEAQAPSSEGFFDPHGPFWKVSRESVVYLGGMRALLMQIAHPKVAQGVADHSRFREDPFGRARRTFKVVHQIVFGTREQALRAAAALHAVHTRVHGRVPEAVPGPLDPTYAANDPQLLLWVYATLVDSSLYACDTFLAPLSAAEREQFYQESKIFARLMGIGNEHLPIDYAAFNAWLGEAIAGELLTITSAAREVAASLLRGPVYLFALRPVTYALTAGTLPPELRERFRLRWTWPVRVCYALIRRAIRLFVRVTPAGWRALPAARRAERRSTRNVLHQQPRDPGQHHDE